MFIAAMFFLAGVLALVQGAQLPGLPSFLILLLVVFAALRCGNRRWVIVLVSFCCGYSYAAIHAHIYLDDRLAEERNGVLVRVIGDVVSIPRNSPDVCSFVLRTVTDNVPKRIRARWYQTDRCPSAGDRWQLKLKLKAPRGLTNINPPGLETWALLHRVGATAVVMNDDHNRQVQSNLRTLSAIRSVIWQRIKLSLNQHPMTGFIGGLVVGVRDDLTPDHWRVLRQTGTNHLMAISGLHIGLIAGLVYGLIRTICAGFNLTCPWRWAILGALLAAGGYAALAGFTIPTRRALVVLLIFSWARWFRRNVTPVNKLSLSLILVLLIDPMSAVSKGFWLSFSAVTAIAVYFNFRLPRKRHVDLVFLQFSIFALTGPLGLIWFHSASLIAPIVNLFLVPLFGLLLIPLCLLSALLLLFWPSAGDFLIRLSADTLQVVWVIMDWVADWSWFQIAIPQLGHGVVVLMLVLGAICVLSLPHLPKLILALSVMPLFFSPVTRPHPGEFDVTVLDVGQGLSVLVRTAGFTLLFDTGNAYLSGSDSASSVILPELHRLGIKRIDLLILSHGDQDHIGGAKTILSQMPVGHVMVGRDQRLQRFGQNQNCESGETWDWDDVRFEILWPQPGFVVEGNEGSCVLLIQGAYGSLLLTGDIERVAEAVLFDHSQTAQVVVAPHHGSATSSSFNWVRSTRARVVIFSAAFGNHWGFPKASVLGRWRAIGARPLCTGVSGAVQVESTADGLKVTERRSLSRRFWQSNSPLTPGCG